MRAAFAGIVDYAGLFPPAGCTMAQAVSSYDSYRGSPDRWMLGRFIVAASRLDELGAVVSAGGYGSPDDPWHLSAVMGVNIPEEVRRIDAFRTAWGDQGLIVDAVEYKASSVGQVLAIDEQLPRDVTRHLEVPTEGPYGQLVAAIKRIGAFAKIRTGGTTPELFPAPEEVIAFLLAVVAHDVPFKATAGLHHPFRGQYPLTYDEGAERTTMYGFVNVLLAVAEIARSGDSELAQQILEDDQHGAFTQSGGTVSWRGAPFDAAHLAAVRARYFLSFGSCSFREPVDELNVEWAA